VETGVEKKLEEKRSNGHRKFGNGGVDLIYTIRIKKKQKVSKAEYTL